MFRRLDEGFINFSVNFDNKIRQRSLLNVPQKYWIHFQILNYLHGFSSIILFVLGSVCFCLGVQHSQYYTKVNCGDGSGLWPPIVNMISAVAGQYAMRVVLYWPSFIHLLLLMISIPFILLVLIDSAVATPWWMHQPIITLPPTDYDDDYGSTLSSIILKLPTLRPRTPAPDDSIPQWKDAFAEIDLSLALFSGINLLLIACILVFYVRWWYPIRVAANREENH